MSDELAKQVADQVTANLQRKAIVDGIVKDKFAGDAELVGYLPHGADPVALHSAADGVVAMMRKFNPNFGKAEQPLPGMTENMSAYARSIKLPNAK